MSYIGFTARIEFRLQTVPTGPGSGSPGPQLTDAAESSLGLFIRTSSGIEQAWLISDLISQTGDTEEPYSWTGLIGDAGFDQDLIDALNAGNAFSLLVDTDDANVDWPNLQFDVATESDDVRLRPSPIDAGGEVFGALSVATPVLISGTIDAGGEVFGAVSVTTPGVSVSISGTVDAGGEVFGALSVATPVLLTPAAIEGGGEVFAALRASSPFDSPYRLRGSALATHANDTMPYVIAGSVFIETAIAERPVARMAVRVPPGSGFAPVDFDEVTIDYPAQVYRAWSEEHANLIAYWRFDEAAVTQAADSEGNTPLDFAGGNDLQYRAYRQEAAAVPYGAAPEWEHTAGAGLSGTLPAGIGAEFTVAGFARRKVLAPGLCHAWRAGSDARALRLAADGTVRLRWGGRTIASPTGTAQEGVWHHLAVTASAADGLRLWVDGAVVASAGATTATLSGRAWQMAQAVGGAAVDLALDEWGIWSAALDVEALYARADHYRAFGGHVYGISDVTDAGAADSHVLQLRLAGYGLRLDHSYVRRVYASASGSSVRAIVQDVLEEAGVDADFDSHGVELTDTVTRAVYPVESVMAILRSLADLHGAIVTVDEWREIDMVRRGDIEHSPLLLTGGRNGNVATIGRTTQPRFFASRAVVVGRGERGVIEQKATGNGVTTRFDATQPIGEVLSITEDGVEETFTGTGSRWTVDTNQQRFELAAGETPPNTAANGLIFLYASAEALVVTADSATAIADIGFPVEVRYEDDSIDTTDVARVVAAARLDRHDQRFEEFIASTIPGRVRRIRPGVAPEWTFPRYGLAATRLLVEKVTSTLAPGAQFGDHNVIHRLTATALDYQGDVGDDYRRPYQPPAPRPATGGTAADPLTTIIRPGNVAVPVSLPIRLGGEAALGILHARGGDVWHVPAGAVLTRVSGHEIAVPLALSFMAQCVPDGSLLASQAVEVRLWDATTNQPVESAVSVDSTVPDRGVLRAIALPLREFDLIYQVRVLANLRGALVWGVTLHLDIGG